MNLLLDSENEISDTDIQRPVPTVRHKDRPGPKPNIVSDFSSGENEDGWTAVDENNDPGHAHNIFSFNELPGVKHCPCLF